MVQYWKGRFGGTERRMILLAALVLLPIFFLPVLPIWQMRLWAPQYREGLTLTIYTNTIKGDVDKINTLNHYVGMKAITASDFKEFSYMPQLLTGFGVMALLAALTGWRWLALVGWLGFSGFAAIMFNDYIQWLWRYGHELDPRAAITLDQFMPPVIGFQKMANFRVLSLPGPGTVLLGAAWLLGPLVLFLEYRATRAGAAGGKTRLASVHAAAAAPLLRDSR